MPITKRQKQIYDFIQSYIQKNQFSPTFEEIKKHFNLSALSTIHQHIKSLIHQGLLIKNGYGARSLELPEKIKANNIKKRYLFIF